MIFSHMYFCWVFSEYMNFNKDFDTNVGEILLDFLQFCKFCVENENSEMRRRVFFFVTQSFKKKPKNVPLPQLKLKHLCCFYFLYRLIIFRRSLLFIISSENFNINYRFFNTWHEMVNEIEFLKIIDPKFFDPMRL